ncbi:hypothetical protein ACJRO7_001997 [Eucalyptus globulus]|uniref:Splicing factor YJU2 n=1 Tax=Eucalyptus globulus TaxID=34317 RepID=A0ABD3LSU2_EUCGL
MGERKVLNRYDPPGFDPLELPRFGTPKSRQIKVWMMLSTSIRCNARRNYIYKGTKFNSRKEVVVNEMYLGVQIFRFYFKCTKCSAELTIKTNLQNSDYVVELGAMRNFELWCKQDGVVENEKRRREAEEMGIAMKSLENKTHDSKREMDILAGLDEFESMKSRHATVDVDATKEKKLAEKDEVLLKSIVFHTSKDFVCRIEDEDSKDKKDLTRPSTRYDESMSNTLKKRKLSEKYSDKLIDLLTTATSSVPIVVVKKVAPSVTIGLQANFSKLWKW